MNGPHFKHVIVGGGIAASSAVEAIRARDEHGSIMLIGQEINRPYHRPPLSKEYLRRTKTRMELTTIPVGWFPKHNVELQTGRRVVQLDPARRTVSLDSGQEVSYDTLLLATGASPAPLKVHGADLPNVFALRTIEDADRIHHAIEKARTEGHTHDRGRGVVAVIGGGLLGVELAGSLSRMGLRVELIHAGAHPWNRLAGENLGRFIARTMEDRGVVMHLNARPHALEGDGRVQRVVLPSGQSIPCDFAISAIGMVINRELLRGTPIRAEKAILVDEHCRTNVSDVFAAGDCAAVLDPRFGKHRIVGHWENARATGAIAGANMAGDMSVRYDDVFGFTTEIFDLRLRGWGEPRLVHHRIVRGIPTAEHPQMMEFGIDLEGRMTQVLSLGTNEDDATLRELVRRRLVVTGREESLKDPAVAIGDFIT